MPADGMRNPFKTKNISMASRPQIWKQIAFKNIKSIMAGISKTTTGYRYLENESSKFAFNKQCKILYF